MKRKILLFTTLRYVELGLFSLVVFLLAKRVPVEEYGMAAPSFIWITISAFFLVGCNQVVVKWFSKSSDSKEKNILILYNIFYNSIIAFCTFFIILFVVRADYAIFIACITASKILLECAATINRILDRFTRVNIVYLCNAIPLCILFFLMPITSIFIFFKTWAMTLFFAVFIAFITIFPYMIQLFQQFKGVVNYFKKNLSALLFDGAKLAFIGFLVPLIGNIDKLILSYFNYSSFHLGVLQLADNIANAVSLGFGVVIFMITPTCIRKISSGEWPVKRFYKKGIIYMSILILLGLIGTYLFSFILNSFFTQYTLLTYPLMIYVLARFLISSLFMFNIIVLSFSLENLYIKLLAIFFIIHIFILVLFNSFLSNTQLFFIIPLVSIFTMMGVHIFSFRAIHQLKLGK